MSLVEVLIVTAVLAVLGGAATVGITGVRERAKLTRLQNDVVVLNNGIDAYLAAGGTVPAGSSAEQVLAKLKTVADPATSTYFGASGPFIDPRMQVVMQSAEQGSTPEPRADYPNSAGYFYVREGGAPGISEFVRGGVTTAVTETRTGPMPYVSGGEFLTAYTEPPAAVSPSAETPQAFGGADEAARTGRDLVKLPRPVLEVRYSSAAGFVPYNGESLELSNYPVDVRVTGPLAIAESQLRIGWDGAALDAEANPYNRAALDVTAYTNAQPKIFAQVFSSDSTRYTNSDPLAVTFKVIPGQVQPVIPVADDIPSTLTYLQAGGPMIVGTTFVASGVTVSNERPPVTVSLSNIETVPARYFSLLSGGLTATYTRRYTGEIYSLTNASFSSSGGFQPGTVPIDVGGFGSATTINISASVQSANSNIIVSGQALDKTVSISPTALAVEVFPLKPIGLPPNVTINVTGNYPVGVRRFYTLTQGTTGIPPLSPQSGGTNISTAVLYTVPITSYPIATYTVSAQATGPVGREHWFTCSAVNRTYIAITAVPLSYVGLNMYQANINGYVKGSIYLQAGEFAVLNAGATVEGNVYVPGLPRVSLPGGGGGTVVNYGQAYDQATDATISTNRITGREYTTDGVLADPQSDLRKIVDLYGSTSSIPAQYEVKINNTARIDGKLFRRSDPPPVSSEKPGLPSGIALSNAAVNVTGTNTLGAGSYAVTMTNTNAVLRLGSPGTITSYVFGAGSSWSAGRVEIIGPVQIYLNSATSFNGVTFGDSNSIYQTGFVVMSNYTVSIDNDSIVFGQFEARDSEISVGSGGGSTVKGTLIGSAFANKISVAGSGFVDVSGGSGTNSLTPTLSPTPTPSATPTP